MEKPPPQTAARESQV